MTSKVRKTTLWSKLLTKEENDLILNTFGHFQKCLAFAVVQLYTTSPPGHNEWNYLDSGILCLVHDKQMESDFFQLYCLEQQTLIWEHEIYNEIKYISSTLFFHTFEAENHMTAFNFASVKESQYFYQTFKNRQCSRDKRRLHKIHNLNGNIDQRHKVAKEITSIHNVFFNQLDKRRSIDQKVSENDVVDQMSVNSQPPVDTIDSETRHEIDKKNAVFEDNHLYRSSSIAKKSSLNILDNQAHDDNCPDSLIYEPVDFSESQDIYETIGRVESPISPGDRTGSPEHVSSAEEVIPPALPARQAKLPEMNPIIKVKEYEIPYNPPEKRPGFFMSFFTGSAKPSKPKFTKSDVSQPYNFQHTLHYGLDSQEDLTAKGEEKEERNMRRENLIEKAGFKEMQIVKQKSISEKRIEHEPNQDKSFLKPARTAPIPPKTTTPAIQKPLPSSQTTANSAPPPLPSTPPPLPLYRVARAAPIPPTTTAPAVQKPLPSSQTTANSAPPPPPFPPTSPPIPLYQDPPTLARESHRTHNTSPNGNKRFKKTQKRDFKNKTQNSSISTKKDAGGHLDSETVDHKSKSYNFSAAETGGGILGVIAQQMEKFKESKMSDADEDNQSSSIMARKLKKRRSAIGLETDDDTDGDMCSDGEWES